MKFLNCFGMGLLGLFLVLSLFFSAGEAHSKARDAVNFEDNNFLQIGEFEFLHEYLRVNRPEPREMERDVFSYQFSYGLMTNYELSARVPIIFFKEANRGVGDASFIQRFKFTDAAESTFSTSGGLELIFPTGEDRDDRPTGTDRLNARPFIAAGTDLTTNVWWTGHLGYTFYGQSELEDEFELNMSFSYRFRDSVRGIFEINLEEDGFNDNRWTSVAPGFWTEMGRGFSIAVSVPVGLNSDAPETRIKGQLIHRF